MARSHLILFAAASAAAALTPPPRDTVGLRDAPLAGTGAQQWLDGVWNVTSADGKMRFPGYVPGDLITDMQYAGFVAPGGPNQDPLYELNWLNSGWDQQAFTYSVNFVASNALVAAGTRAMLVLEGVKMAADVSLNGIAVGFVNNMFLRYEWDVSNLLKAGGDVNTLAITFTTSSDARNDAGRWSACSGGWDWAPYSSTAANGAMLRTLSKGIWRSVSLVPVALGGVAIDQVAPLVYYNGSYPTSPLSDASNGPWEVHVRVFLTAPSAVPGGTLRVAGTWPGAEAVTQPVDVPAGNSSVTVVLKAANVPLWWPNGMGAQTMFTVNATWTSGSGALTSTLARPTAFRTFYLVTVDDSVPGAYAGKQGTGNLTMRFKVNGADIYARGGNLIPPENLEGRLSADTYRQIAHAAADANMNLVRVWGGGVYPPDAFWETASERGLLAYTDAMFGGDGRIAPTGSALEEAELRYQTRRQAAWPAVALLDSCNECGGEGIYASFVATTMAQEDPSRPIWPSCPSPGWQSGVDTLTGLPTGDPLVPYAIPAPWGPFDIEAHGYYQHGGGWPAVNGDPKANGSFGANLPPVLADPSNTSYGTTAPGIFYSEFGASAWASWESVGPTLDPAHWALHGGMPANNASTCNGQFSGVCPGPNPLAQRNYPADNWMATYFPSQLPTLNTTGTASFQGQLYLATIAHALWLAADITNRRTQNHWGTSIWQINEIWPTGGWGTLEYGTVGFTAGQVLGGRWKPIQHMLASYLYRDVFIACGSGGANGARGALCVVKNDDALRPLQGVASIALVNVVTGVIQTSKMDVAVTLPRGAGQGTWFCMDTGAAAQPGSPCTPMAQYLSTRGCNADGTDCALLVSVSDLTTGAVLSGPFTQYVGVADALQTLEPQLSAVVAPVKNADGSVNVTVTAAAAPAWAVHLTTLAQGRFSDNVFTALPGVATTLRFLPLQAPGADPVDLPLLQATLRVDHLHKYLGGAKEALALGAPAAAAAVEA